MTIEMTIKENTTSASNTVTATEMLTFDFSNLHQTTNGVVKYKLNIQCVFTNSSPDIHQKEI